MTGISRLWRHWGALGNGGPGTPGLGLGQCWGGHSAHLQPILSTAAPNCSRPPGEDALPISNVPPRTTVSCCIPPALLYPSSPAGSPNPAGSPSPAGSPQSCSADLSHTSGPSRAVAPDWAGTGTQLPQSPWPQGLPCPALSPALALSRAHLPAPGSHAPVPAQSPCQGDPRGHRAGTVPGRAFRELPVPPFSTDIP